MKKNPKTNEGNFYERDYEKIVNNVDSYSSFRQMPQWNNPGDLIVKFSLLKEIPNTIATTSTLASSITK